MAIKPGVVLEMMKSFSLANDLEIMHLVDQETTELLRYLSSKVVQEMTLSNSVIAVE